MDVQTALVFALQLVALFSIAGALLLYLLCKIRGNSKPDENGTSPGGGKPVLITCCDNVVGLQVAIHLANRGFRVFAGLKEGATEGCNNDDSVPSRVIRSWQKHRESTECLTTGALIALPIDVTREDVLHEAVDIIRAHLPAGKDGLWAVINTGGLLYRGKLDQQNISHWDAMLKTTVLGILRVTRAFQGLLRSAGGRIITFGAIEGGEAGLVAYTASRYAVEGASNALREELSPMGIKVVCLNNHGLPDDLMFAMPKLKSKQESGDVSVDMSGCLDYYPTALSDTALQTLDVAITSGKPKRNYTLMRNPKWLNPLQFVKVV
ncbi:D-beta-hydroxybutyrate dehydrogenase, mitochondrial [Agrilus planipennis]|uniref:D-beta-hydroxybutyrate dehydrogenase, mitochondrial n=1 Tax=Agrilus planipennis TaxID=224129 RepID=A0A1W4XAX4_AGRPL|nr:D-beta-hydroxybutyrate dehydrogenase, mitochondrial [Agrilus planipennis]XP_018329968.1 D-beta-hydroxybutyrate dehydrogenase, mitochondrial [Agrilus planipennis]